MRATTGDDRTLRRIIALLVALAALAERAAARSLPVRWLVLCILLQAEAVARGFVAEATGMPQPAIEGIAAVRNGPADAIGLAARFMALAAALCALLPVACRLDSRPARPGGACARNPSLLGRPDARGTLKPYDTS